MVPDYYNLARGGLCVQQRWLDGCLLDGLREDVHRLQGAGLFVPSGVATAGADGIYSTSDRRVCVLSPPNRGDTARWQFERRLDSVRTELEVALGRQQLTTAERYFSLLGPGQRLGQHMDERHEETKGERGWEATTRRSISWLVYLSDPGWDEDGGAGAGGHLRARCRSSTTGCGAHAANLQVGWLEGGGLVGSAADEGSEECVPVFLDSWRRVAAAEAASGRRWVACSALYRVDACGKREYLTGPFSQHSPSWPAVLPSGDGGMTPAAFAEALRAQLPSDLRGAFSGIEAESARQQVVEVSPAGGTLVLFDSVAVPHEVLPTLRGERVALAGWFHEAQQSFPAWYGT